VARHNSTLATTGHCISGEAGGLRSRLRASRSLAWPGSFEPPVSARRQKPVAIKLSLTDERASFDSLPDRRTTRVADAEIILLGRRARLTITRVDARSMTSPRRDDERRSACPTIINSAHGVCSPHCPGLASGQNVPATKRGSTPIENYLETERPHRYQK